MPAPHHDIADHASHLVVTATGAADGAWLVSSSGAEFRRHAAEARRLGRTRVLYDIRALDLDVRPLDRYVGAEMFAAAMGTTRVALLGRPDQSDPDYLFVTVAVNRGATVSLFYDPSEALNWLLGDGPVIRRVGDITTGVERPLS